VIITLISTFWRIQKTYRQLSCFPKSPSREKDRHVGSTLFLSTDDEGGWTALGSDLPAEQRKMTSPSASASASTPTLAWSGDGFRLTDALSKEMKFNADDDISHIDGWRGQLFTAARNTSDQTSNAQRDNATPHMAKWSHDCCDEHFMKVPHPPISPDLARSDTWLFAHQKDQLKR
jgi:hypothetical protein